MGTRVCTGEEGGDKRETGAQGTKDSDGEGEVSLEEEISPHPLQQKAQVSKGVWVEMSVLSSWRASSQMKIDKCLFLSWRSCMETVSRLTSCPCPCKLSGTLQH